MSLEAAIRAKQIEYGVLRTGPADDWEQPWSGPRAPHARRSFGLRLWLAKMAVVRENARGPRRAWVTLLVALAHVWWWCGTRLIAATWVTTRWACRTAVGGWWTAALVDVVCWCIARQAPEVRYGNARDYAGKVRNSASSGVQ